jgi:arabinose-5-phosphate isomerase
VSDIDITLDGATRPDAIARSVSNTLSIGIDGLVGLQRATAGRLGARIVAAVSLMHRAAGRVIVTGMGKSGHIGAKLAATLSSTGTPAFFVHPAEASHGDLGMITPDDVILALSWSGETAELASIIVHSRRFKVPLIAVTSQSDSALGRASDVCLELPSVAEACPHGLAPTTSTLMQLVLGDSIAVALLEAKGFSAQDFRTFHPGGSLGGRLKLVSDLMHTGDRLPLVGLDEPMSQAIITMSNKSFGCLGIVDDAGDLVGMITDGDLRRHMGDNFLIAAAGTVMTRSPKTIVGTALAASALEIMNTSRISALFVVDATRPVGIVHVHDLLRAGVV